MSIKTQLRIAAWLPALFGLLVGALLWRSWEGVEQARTRAQRAEASVRTISELNALTQEFLLYGGPRVSAQLAKQQEFLTATLAAAQFPRPEQQALLESIRQGQGDLERLLRLLLEGTAVSREQVAGALLVKVQDLRFKARRLASREHDEVVLIQRQADHLVLFALAALTLLSVTLLTWLSRRLIRGLDRLGAAMHQVEGGDLVQEVALERGDELGRLAAAFNDMTRRLRASYTLVDERTAALSRRSAELEAANADLEAFSYSVSHDLRAPLRVIDGFAAILRALKFSQSRDPAVIEVAGRQETAQTPVETIYSVTDNGVGFDAAYSDKLFGLFQRLHGMDEFEGTGVGLAIVKRFIEKHGGRVTGEGQPDAGATFRFSLPGGHDDQ